METVSVAIACSIIGATLSYLTFQKNNRKDIKAETRDEVETRTKLDYISKGVDDIRIDIKAHQRDIQEIKERLIMAEGRIIVAEGSIKKAHDRIDMVEEV